MEQQTQKGQWKSQFGFLMASIGSAVGLGNLWAFPYKMGKSGGFAFLIVYLALVFVVGMIVMLCELTLGRKTGKGVIEAYESLGHRYKWVGVISWISPILILGFYSMLGGYCLKYLTANVGDLFGASWGTDGADSETFFTNFYTDRSQAVVFTLIFIALASLIVCAGVSKGIEKFTSIATPLLFVMLIIIIIRSVTLPGAGAGVEFIFKPDFTLFRGAGWIKLLARAGGQMFFSMSLGMGIMITYGSYMRREDDIQKSSVIIPIADTVAALFAAMAIMPAVFAEGLDPAQGPGLLFVTLQTVFKRMGAIGPIFGCVFYLLVFIAAIDPSISLMEAAGSALLDRDIAKGRQMDRKKNTLIVALITAAEGVLISVDCLGASNLPHLLGQGSLLDLFDLFSEGLLMPTAALMTSLIFGWIMPGWLDDEITYAGEGKTRAFRMKKYFYLCLKFIVPPMMVLVLLGQIDIFFKLGWF